MSRNRRCASMGPLFLQYLFQWRSIIFHKVFRIPAEYLFIKSVQINLVHVRSPQQESPLYFSIHHCYYTLIDIERFIEIEDKRVTNCLTSSFGMTKPFHFFTVHDIWIKSVTTIPCATRIQISLGKKVEVSLSRTTDPPFSFASLSTFSSYMTHPLPHKKSIQSCLHLTKILPVTRANFTKENG